MHNLVNKRGKLSAQKWVISTEIFSRRSKSAVLEISVRLRQSESVTKITLRDMVILIGANELALMILGTNI